MGGYWTSLTYDSIGTRYFITGITNARDTWNFYTEPADRIGNGRSHYPAPGTAMYEDYRITVTNPLGGKEEYFYSAECHYSTDYDCGWYVSPKYYINYVDANTNNYTNVSKTHFKYIKPSSSADMGEILKITYPESDYISFGYDSSGNRTSVTDSYGTARYAYNDMGRITSVTDARGMKTNLTYASNNVDLIGIQNSGLGTISAAYNNFHQIISLTDRMNNTTLFSYNSYGQPISQRDALSVITSYVYDANHRLQQATRNGQTLGNLSYDAIGRVSSYTDAAASTLVFSRNNLDNITRVIYPDGKLQYPPAGYRNGSKQQHRL